MKKLNKTFVTATLIIALLAVSFIPGRNYFMNKTFEQALALNKAISIINFKVTPEYNGKVISCDKMIVSDLSIKPKKGQKTSVISYKSVFTKTIRAKWIDMKLEGFDKNGKPKYDYVFLVRSYMITVLDIKDSLMGTAVVSIIPNKAILVTPVEIRMHKTKFKKIDKTSLNDKIILGEGGGGYTVIEESKEEQGWTDIVNLRSAYGESSQAVFPMGSVVYIQSKSRGDSQEPLTTQWSDAGPNGVQIQNRCTSGYRENGSSSVVQVYTDYMYVRKRIVAETNFGTYVSYEEDVYPISANGVRDVPKYLNTPNNISGQKTPVGSSPGGSLNINLYGTSGYFFVPAVSLNFGVNYGENGGTVGISITLSAEAHYRQNVYIHSEIVSSNGGKTLWAFDNNTNWKEVYFKWGY